MKRDLDLIRLILLKIEDAPSGQSVHNLEFEGFEPEIINEHVGLLVEAGLIEAQLAHSFNSSDVLAVTDYDIRRLTWEGHDFVANARNKTIWDKVLTTLLEKGGVVSVGIVQALLIDVAKKHVGIG